LIIADNGQLGAASQKHVFGIFPARSANAMCGREPMQDQAYVNERWPLMAVLTWIAARSRKFAEKLAFSDPATAGQFLHGARQNHGAPYQVSYPDAFHSLLEKIQSGGIAGTGRKIQWTVEVDHEHLPAGESFALAKAPGVSGAYDFQPQECLNADRGNNYTPGLQDFTFHDGDCLTSKGSGCGAPNPDGSRIRWTWKGVTFSRREVLRAWPDFPCFSAWEQAKAQAWQPPGEISSEWLKNLPPGPYVPLSEATGLLAFGPGRSPIGLSDIDNRAARLRAGLALMLAAKSAKVALLGTEAALHPTVPGAILAAGPLRELDPEELGGISLVIDGAPDWLGPTRFADRYPEAGHAAESLSFAGVSVHRETFRRWLLEISGKTAKKRGRREQYPWAQLEQKTYRLMDEHGDFDAGDPEWDAQARLEEKLLEFCLELCSREPSRSTLEKHLKPWLENWRRNKTSAGNSITGYSGRQA
jgi:hypothetical protein